MVFKTANDDSNNKDNSNNNSNGNNNGKMPAKFQNKKFSTNPIHNIQEITHFLHSTPED